MVEGSTSTTTSGNKRRRVQSPEVEPAVPSLSTMPTSSSFSPNAMYAAPTGVLPAALARTLQMKLAHRTGSPVASPPSVGTRDTPTTQAGGSGAGTSPESASAAPQQLDLGDFAGMEGWDAAAGEDIYSQLEEAVRGAFAGPSDAEGFWAMVNDLGGTGGVWDANASGERRMGPQ
jgi:hypothetical protein